jgi:TPR repeat protein
VSHLPENEEPGLLDEQASLETAGVTWKGTMAALGGLAQMGIPPFITGPPLIVAAICWTVVERKRIAVKRLLADPPRLDFETETRARRRRYVAGALGDNRLAVATDEAAIATLRAAAYFEAAVRADERSQGAALEGRAQLAEWQLSQSRRLLELGKMWSGEMAVALNAFAQSWAAYAAESELETLALPQADLTPRPLPPEAREALDRTGLVVGDLDLTVRWPAELDRQALVGASTGDLAIEAARTTRTVSWSTRQVAGGRRALPERSGEDEALPPLLPPADGAAEVEQWLLPAAEGGSADAMFDLGSLAHDRGDRAAAREWFERAARANTPRPRDVFLAEAREWTERAERESPSPSTEVRELPERPAEEREAVAKADFSRVGEYWSALSANGRSVFRGAAQIENRRGPGYTLDDIAEVLGISVASVRSRHRSTGRTARSWRAHTGTEAPIELIVQSYGWDAERGGNRTRYRLPSGVAETITNLP